MTTTARFGWKNVAALAPVVVVGLFTIAAVRGTSRAVEEMASFESGFELVRSLDRILMRIQDAETAQRGFVITGDSAFLQPYTGAREDVIASLDVVGSRLEGAGTAAVAALASLTERRLDLIDRAIALRTEVGEEAALVAIRSGEGLLLMEEIRRRLREVEAEQLASFAVLQRERDRSTSSLLLWLFVGSVVTILFAWLVNGALLRHAREQRSAAAELEEKNAELEDQAIELEHQAAELEAQALELEEALDNIRENEELFRALIENATDLIAVVDSNGRPLYQSPSSARLLPEEDGAGGGASLVDALHPEDRRPVMAELRTVRRDPTRLGRFEARISDRQGGWRHLTATARLLPQPSALAGVVVNAQDVTETKRLEEQFHHAQRMEAVGRLAGGVAHDFSNILGIIKGHVQLLQLEIGAHNQLFGELQLINDASDRAAGLVRQLLAFSRKQILQPRLIDLNELVSETEKMLHRVIGSDIELRTALDSELGRVNADPGQMQQVLLNLAVNSRDAMPDGGSLVIATRNVEIAEGVEDLYPHLTPGSPAVLLTVSDSGIGMDAELQKQIFEPFFSTKEQGKGTGLGLSTVYGIVKQSRGYIWVYSEPGHGTTFRIYLPRIDARDAPRPQKPLPPRALPGQGRILLVEDDPQLRTVTRRLLERGGYRVEEAQNGIEALRICNDRGADLDLLVTDLAMPQMSGAELARHVKAALPQLPILFVSGHTDDTLIRMGQLPPGAAFIQKPVDTTELLRAAARLIGLDGASGG